MLDPASTQQVLAARCDWLKAKHSAERSAVKAVAVELHRSQVVSQTIEKMAEQLDRLLSPPQSSTDRKSSTPAAVAAATRRSSQMKARSRNLFTAFVFERLSSCAIANGEVADHHQGNFDEKLKLECESEIFDPLLPIYSGEMASPSPSIVKRLTPLIHDARVFETTVDDGSGGKVPAAEKIQQAAESFAIEVAKLCRSGAEEVRRGPMIPFAPSQLLVTLREVEAEILGTPAAMTHRPSDPQNGSDEKMIEVKAGRYAHRIWKRYLIKLKSFYDRSVVEAAKFNSIDDEQVTNFDISTLQSDEEFKQRLFILLQRYFALTGCSDDQEGDSGWHGSLPPQFMGALKERMGLDCECFASPLNAALPFFCSAFPDSDCFFGSLGSFFDQDFAEGCYEANPPFEHTVALRMANHMLDLLRQADRNVLPLSFVIVFPSADEGRQLKSAEELLHKIRKEELSEYLADDRLVSSQEAPYVSGLAQSVSNDKRYFAVRLDTQLLVLQSKKAREMVPDVQSRIASIVAIWGLDKGLLQKSSAAGGRKRPREE